MLSYPYYISYPILSYPGPSYFSHPLLSYAIQYYLIFYYIIHPVLSYPILSYLILSYRTYPIFSYPILSYRIFLQIFLFCPYISKAYSSWPAFANTLKAPFQCMRMLLESVGSNGKAWSPTYNDHGTGFICHDRVPQIKYLSYMFVVFTSSVALVPVHSSRSRTIWPKTVRP